jgi:AcrR family transcriptional regulator
MITKRTQNAAHIRYKIINYVLQTCQHKDFDKLYVTEICQAANISKVTFFKYFERKEDVLMLYKSIINTGICIEVSQRGLKSLKGLSFITNRFVHIIRETPSIARELVSTLLHAKPPILPIILTEADKALFFPDVRFEEVNLISFWDLIEGFMLEGVLTREITKMASPPELATMYIANLYGAIITSHIKSQDQQAVVFNNINKNWLKCLA